MADEGKSWLDWGNVPQWISALCAFALAALAVYGLFFSQTSQALVAYLQSELAVRNQRIAGLEVREQQLQQSVSTAQATLGDLADKKTLAEKQIASLNAEQSALSAKIADLGMILDNTQFSLVKEKINARMAAIFNVSSIFMADKLEDGIRAETMRPWNDQSAFIKQKADEIPEPDKQMAARVYTNFLAQCARFKDVTIDMPALKISKGTDFSQYGYDRSKHPTAKRLEAIMNKVEAVQKDIDDCFRSTKP